ncbi:MULTISPECIES: hypothetical protein [unclassified Sphingomonas]|mgnify:CR=1 FL=1|uniref:hypothetical protein n=1 Tax=unclassified Sphingomonas TaxID=196159 RepID=UPI0025D6051D|nr:MULTISPECIES: hypothetical protein [unclassified Sphingomonas]
MSLADRLKRLSPGLVTGADDDDPSGIATYSQAGAQFRTGLMWTMTLAYPADGRGPARGRRVTGNGAIASCERPTSHAQTGAPVSSTVAL